MTIRTIQIPVGAGKANPSICPGASPTISSYVIEKDEIERQDITRLMETFKFQQPLENLRLKQGKIEFLVSGYDGRPEELYEIPEVREYFLKAHQEWPCWLFSCSILGPNLFVIASCVMSDLLIARTRREKGIHLQIPKAGLLKFFEDGLPLAAEFHRRIGISQYEGVKMLWPISIYLQIAGD